MYDTGYYSSLVGILQQKYTFLVFRKRKLLTEPYAVILPYKSVVKVSNSVSMGQILYEFAEIFEHLYFSLF